MHEDLKALARDAVASSRASSDPDYPIFHVAPPVGRLNDPNGLLVDDGTFHVFYQFSPFHPHRKLVYWGHASSTDLSHWEHHPPAVVPNSSYDASGAYSGNAVVLDEEEVGSAPAAAPFQLFYTGNLKDPVTDERTASQCLVTSPDLATFTKWPDNPLVPVHAEGYTAHYRDPMVVRDPDRPGEYRMLVGAQRRDETGAAVVYRSNDLVTWAWEGELSFPQAGGAFDRFGYMWECPGIVRLSDEVTGEERDVLIFCPQGIRPEQEGFENIFPCVYTVGRLEGTQLRDCDGTFYEVDRGFEFYAPQVFARRPSEPGPVLMMGWAGNASEDDQPSIEPDGGTGGWVHTLTVPRVLSLRGGRLVQRPAVPWADHASRPSVVGAVLGTGSHDVAELGGSRSWYLRLEAQEDMTSGTWGLRIGSETSHVDIMLGDGVLTVDRSTSRYTQHGQRRTVSLPPGCAPALEVLHDRSVTEIFVGDGDLAFTLRSFVGPGGTAADHVGVDVGGARLLVDGSLRLHEGVAAPR
ncbi:glycoside hydrolase family 32 protein [Actinomyces sp. 2119]|uniref:glycoside hydrolase family 32 protein n=1 Tax=Actinomyces sp. 2119 TaxID=2321393 RepID=UPI000E6C9A32|nr:glycoside hydrolase family 32 protein [Actinomyces sp. 2119]RJF44775.1 glycoside hydrolase family 32 protein [Actinomyces sp. 2119]